MTDAAEVLIELDGRRRMTLRLGQHDRYLAREEADGSIVLVPAVVIPAHQARLDARPDLLARFEESRGRPDLLVKRPARRAAADDVTPAPAKRRRSTKASR